MIHIFSRNNCEKWCITNEIGYGTFWQSSLKAALFITDRRKLCASRWMVDIGRANPGCTYYGLFKDYDDFVSQYPELFV